MSAGRRWPGGAPGALSLTFDNLGEAAEVQMGAASLPEGPGSHFTVVRLLPALLDELGSRGLRATFFVEGVNAEVYPEALRSVSAGGHEVAYHAWCHEEWAGLGAAQQAENLRRGVAALRRLELEPAGFRPPGGLLGPGGVGVVREAGLSYASPAGRGAGLEGEVALLPFEWRQVDASCVLPPLAAARVEMTGGPDPVPPGVFVDGLLETVGELTRRGGYSLVVLHLAMLDWLGDELRRLLDAIAAAQGEKLWVAPCAEVARMVHADPNAFANGAELDRTSWSSAG